MYANLIQFDNLIVMSRAHCETAVTEFGLFETKAFGFDRKLLAYWLKDIYNVQKTILNVLY